MCGYRMKQASAWLIVSLFGVFLFITLGCSEQETVSDRRRRAQEQLSVSNDAGPRDVGAVADASLDDLDDADFDDSESIADADDGANFEEESVRDGGRASRVLDDLRQSRSLQGDEASIHADRGDMLFEQSQFEEAVQQYRRALELDPGLDRARQRLNEALVVLGDRSGVARVAEQVVGEARVREQQRRLEIRRHLEAARQALTDGRPDVAEHSATLAVELIDVAQDYPAEQAREARTLLQRIRRDQERLRAEERDRLYGVADEQAIQQQRELERRRRNQVRLLLRKTRRHMLLKEFDKAVESCDLILEQDPGNRIAKFWRDDAASQQLKRKQLNLIQDRLENERLLEENIAESLTPYNEVFVFPEADEWKLVRQRAGSLEFETLDDPEPIRRIKNILNQEVTLSFEGNTTLSDAVATLREILGINIGVDPDVNPDDLPVKLNVQDLPARSALNLILTQVDLAYAFRENILFITPPDQAAGDRHFRIYNVRDILNKVRDFAGPALLLRGPGDTGDGGDAISFTSEAAEEEDQIDPEILLELITESTGGIDAWEEPNRYEIHRGNLLITAPPEMHRDVEAVLENLRKDSDLFVVVEARFIDINDDFLEDIGIDTRALGVNNNFGTPFGNVVNDSSTGGQELGFVKQGSPTRDVTLVMGQDRWGGRVQHVIDGFTGSFRRNGNLNAGGGVGGLTVQQTWLEPFQINTILRAVQEKADVRQLTAPVITAANGQRVYVSVITQRAYIADYELVSGGTGFSIVEVADPVVQTFQEGVILDVQPVISHDKKYVTLDVRPTLATLIGGTISTINISLGSFTNVAFQVPVGVPEISLQQAFTSVTVPNGGTVLLGGFKSVDEQKLKAYIPILGDIPIVGNLFRRKARVKETRSLVILISARIVDLRAAESRSFNEAD